MMLDEFIENVIQDINKKVKAFVYAKFDEKTNNIIFKIETHYFTWCFNLELHRYFEKDFNEDSAVQSFYFRQVFQITHVHNLFIICLQFVHGQTYHYLL
jgi:hypothetical protein